ncbi:hypothetical protein SM001_002280 [Cronobacter sakazakii]|nr:hypothetical protein [Cronobacter sakazakii]
MKFKGTPGEWKYRGPLGEIYSEDDGVIADLLVNGKEDENGRLIAAAPDLLEALNSIMELQTRGYVVLGDKCTEMASAAIAKAIAEEE